MKLHLNFNIKSIIADIIYELFHKLTLEEYSIEIYF
jgi:hypothetical protein